MANAQLSRDAAKLFTEYKVPIDIGFDWATELQLADSMGQLSDDLQAFLTNPYFINPSLNGIEKHLQGKHDQSTHAGKKSYESFDDLANDGDSIQNAVDELFDSSIGRSANGNVAMRVLLERMGKGGKPEIVRSAKQLDGEPIYRGTNTENAEGFKNNDYDRIGRGAMGDGYYFSDSPSTATDYANQFDGGKVITAGWKKDAKVYDFSVSGRVTEDNYLDNLMEMGGETTQRVWDDWNMESSATSGQDNAFTNFFNDENNAAVTSLMLQGYDGMTIKQPSGETYTVVFNREAMQVVAD